MNNAKIRLLWRNRHFPLLWYPYPYIYGIYRSTSIHTHIYIYSSTELTCLQRSSCLLDSTMNTSSFTFLPVINCCTSNSSSTHKPSKNADLLQPLSFPIKVRPFLLRILDPDWHVLNSVSWFCWLFIYCCFLVAAIGEKVAEHFNPRSTNHEDEFFETTRCLCWFSLWICWSAIASNSGLIWFSLHLVILSWSC